MGKLKSASVAFIKEWIGDMAEVNAPAKLALFTGLRAIIARNALLLETTLVISLGFLWLEPGGHAVWIVPILVFVGIWFVLVGIKERADYQALQRTGPPKSGQWTAVWGTAQALEKIEGDILAYRLQILDVIRRRSEDFDGDNKESKKNVCRYDGYYLVPTGINTQNGTVRLIGFPDLTFMDKISLPSDFLTRAKDTAYDSPTWLPKPLAREIILAAIHDRVERSLHYSSTDKADKSITSSWILRDGDEICIFGYWKDGTLTTAKNRPRGMPVYKGSVEEVREHLSGLGNAFLVIGAVFLSIALGTAIWSLM